MIKDKILDELKKISKTKGSYVFVSAPENYNDTRSFIARYLTSELNLHGVYVSLNKPTEQIVAEFSEKKVNVKNLHFIDSTGKNADKDKRRFHISNNQSLTELSLVITYLTKTNNFDFLLFDSVSTLLMYNELSSVEKFVQFIINKMRNVGLTMITFSVDEENSNKLVSVISQFCDKVIKV